MLKGCKHLVEVDLPIAAVGKHSTQNSESDLGYSRAAKACAHAFAVWVTSEVRMLYFAYGSNLDWAQMSARCPSAQFLCRALLPSHRLAFTRFSKNRGCGVADVVSDDSQGVWGVVYEIPAAEDLETLDRHEGFRPDRAPSSNAYNRREVVVLEDGDASKPLTVWAYFAVREADEVLPSGEYKRLLVEGARRWGLPASYVETQEQIEVMS